MIMLVFAAVNSWLQVVVVYRVNVVVKLSQGCGNKSILMLYGAALSVKLKIAIKSCSTLLLNGPCH